MQTSAPLISVGVPTYIRSDLLRKAVQSCLDQDFQDFEILVSDDSTTDEIERMIKSFGSPKIRYIHHDPPAGLQRRLNNFLEDGQARWMVMLGDDDQFEPGYLSAMARIVTENPDAALVRTRYRFIDHDGNFVKLAQDEPARLEPLEFLNVIFLPWYRRMVSITGVLFPREKLRELGGFLYTRQGRNSDTAAWAWLGAQGPCYFESRPLVRLRFARDSVYKRFDADYGRYLEDKRLFFDNMQALFQSKAEVTDSRERRKLARARSLCNKYWMRDEARFHLGKVFVFLLKQKKTWVRQEITDILDAINASRLPIHSPIFSFYSALSYLPADLREAALMYFDKGRSLYCKFFPPEDWTFFKPTFK